jgi:hypothetical protein
MLLLGGCFVFVKGKKNFVLFCAEGRKSFIFVTVLASIDLSFKFSQLRDCQ